MPIELHTLNENQRNAVLWDDGPLLVLAGPGSGKTRVLSMRVARLVEESQETSVLALTFTNKAAAEMRERVELLLGQRAERARLCTFHSYASEVLRQHGSHVGVRPDFTLLTQDEDRIVFLEIVAEEFEKVGEDVPSDRKSLLRLIDHLFREAYSGEEEAPGLRNTPGWLSAFFRRYVEILLEHNRLDYGSLIHLVCRLFEEKAGVARVLRIGWSHVCVDEFQDTNKAQYRLLRLLVPSRTGNFFVVGDDDQIIYQWNGASPERLQVIREDYDVEVLELPKNYRCPGEIIEIANRLIQNNKRRTEKLPLEADRTPTGLEEIISYHEFNTPHDEAKYVAESIFDRGVEAADCVVLARTAKLLHPVEEAMRGLGLTPYLPTRKVDFETAPVRTVVCALRLANARHDREILRQLCVAWESLTETRVSVEDVVAAATLEGGDFLRAWISAVDQPTSQLTASLVAKVRESLVERLEFPGVVDWFLENLTNWQDVFGKDLEEELEIWRDIHEQYLAEHGHRGATLHGYLQSMDLSSKVAPPPKGAIHCLTIHGAKGLEFKHVYLIGMAQEVLPSFQALQKGANSRELEEERRNFFVALTRTQETLTLTRSKQYNGWSKGPSQFLFEMVEHESLDV